MGMIGELIGTISNFVPVWMLVLGAAVLLVLAAPGYLTGMKVKRMKARMRKTVRATGEERLQLVAEVWALSENHGDVLVALVKEADKLNQPRLRDRALRRLRKLGTHPDEVRRLSGPADKREDRRHHHPLEAAAAIRALLEAEAWEAARERLKEAQRRFPDEEVLEGLASELGSVSSSS